MRLLPFPGKTQVARWPRKLNSGPDHVYEAATGSLWIRFVGQSYLAEKYCACRKSNGMRTGICLCFLSSCRSRLLRFIWWPIHCRRASSLVPLSNWRTSPYGINSESCAAPLTGPNSLQRIDYGGRAYSRNDWRSSLLFVKPGYGHSCAAKVSTFLDVENSSRPTGSASRASKCARSDPKDDRENPLWGATVNFLSSQARH